LNIRIIILLLISAINGFPQMVTALGDDPCGYDSAYAALTLKTLGTGWGYTYDSLLADLKIWQKSPFVKVDSAGASVQNRGIWLVTITDTMQRSEPLLRITIHSRTHPGEVQATWVTNALISELLSDSPLAQTLLKKCIFNIIPMYNPDGVELGLARENANGVDLEREWSKPDPQPEPAVLKALYQSYMTGDSPIRVALNMHSSISCTRYFVYHDENGTSSAYAEAEKFFITGIHDQWPEGIEPWNYYISWTTGTPDYYPESWFWLNFHEAVMALTYEDMNCPENGEYDRTALVILEGIADFLGIRETSLSPPFSGGRQTETGNDLVAYPNPAFSGTTFHIKFNLIQPGQVSITLYDLLGRKIIDSAQFKSAPGAQEIMFRIPQLAQGYYILRLNGAQISRNIPLMILH
jgi:hypothetical protein